MANLCSNCAPNSGAGAGIPIASIFENLENGETEHVFCEGCELAAIEKTNDGEMKLHYLSELISSTRELADKANQLADRVEKIYNERKADG